MLTAAMRKVASGSAAGVRATHAFIRKDPARVTGRQTGAVAVAIRLHGVFQNFRTAPSLEAALPTYRHSAGHSEECLCAGTYLRGSGSCSMMNAQPELSLGFFSAFLMT